MWRDKQIKFLTESEFSESELINVLKEDCSNFENNSEKKILQQIIDDFEKKDFSLFLLSAIYLSLILVAKLINITIVFASIVNSFW